VAVSLSEVNLAVIDDLEVPVHGNCADHICQFNGAQTSSWIETYYIVAEIGDRIDGVLGSILSLRLLSNVIICPNSNEVDEVSNQGSLDRVKSLGILCRLLSQVFNKKTTDGHSFMGYLCKVIWGHISPLIIFGDPLSFQVQKGL
jgi:hypothetical protein